MREISRIQRNTETTRRKKRQNKVTDQRRKTHTRPHRHDRAGDKAYDCWVLPVSS
jgi:hypothetical protein